MAMERSAPSERSTAASSAAAWAMLKTASARDTLAGRTARAFSVASGSRGMKRQIRHARGNAMRVATGPSSLGSATVNAPYRAAATLSACPSTSLATRRSVRRSSGSPMIALAATTPPTMAAALDPSPPAAGRAAAVGVLHPVPGETAHPPLRASEPPGPRPLAQPGDRRCRGRLGENPLAAGQEAVCVEDLAVADRVDRAPRLVSGGHRPLPRRRVSDPDRGRDGFRLGDGRPTDKRGRAFGLVSIHPRSLPGEARLGRLDEALPE